MDPTQFPTVRPAPFLFAQAPASIPSIVGMRSFDPTLPPVGGYADADLERLRFSLMRSNADPAMLARVEGIIRRRRGYDPGGMVDPEAALLRPTPQKVNAVRQFGRNAVDARQQLLDAMTPVQ